MLKRSKVILLPYPKTHLLAQKKELAEVGEFIYKQAIPALVKDLLYGDIILPCDSKGLGELFHAHGINVRYIGKVCQSFNKAQSPFIHILLERIMLTKSIKHFVRVLFRQTSSLYHADMAAHVLNCIFASKKGLSQLENTNAKTLYEQTERPEQSATEAKGDSQEDKKKKKKKKSNTAKKQKDTANFISPLMDFGSIKIDTGMGDFINLKPSDVWSAIRNICKKRYLYDLPESAAVFEPFQHPLTKLATLRDVCLSTGIVLECKNYNLLDKKNEKEEESKSKETDIASFNPDTLPFRSQDVINIVPIVKHLDPTCEDAKAQIELVKSLSLYPYNIS